MSDSAQRGGEPSWTSAVQLQNAVCERLTKDGALDSIRRKIIDHIRNDAVLNARLRELLDARCRGGDLDGLEGKPKGVQRNKVSEIKSEILASLQGDAEAALWQLLTGPDSDVASEVATRAHEALCSVAEEDARAWAEAWRRARDEEQQQRRAERRAGAAGGQQQQQQQQQQWGRAGAPSGQQPGFYAPRGGGGSR
ncbi:hypothetical protein Rsub_02723 [Raphidocelis subcapitata]|uniref:Uncharacterized protein n=1 Tax=Raphidocelis subcapitata TaxID=307507 RepID=A0A2V0NYL2_9CHLO|nr:hypothetical protein Rsub_02723 [Raphidocelis subcapitata]|eukprot:GBF90017.1 hypothetical protein Rsub_02723 [Raphidocelis subcapitata]